MFVRRENKDCGVITYSFMCCKCEAENRVCLADPMYNSVGAQCRGCNQIVWTNFKDNNILAELFDLKSTSDYKKNRAEILKRFLQAIPACPECGLKDYIKVITNTLDGDVNCSECDTFFYPNSWNNISDEVKNEMCWWYENLKN